MSMTFETTAFTETLSYVSPSEILVCANHQFQMNLSNIHFVNY